MRANHPPFGETKDALTAGARARAQAYALRALRLLFSLERNRKSFKRIFPPATFERFIEVGQYQRDLAAFSALTEEVAAPLAFLPAPRFAVCVAIANGRACSVNVHADRAFNEHACFLTGHRVFRGQAGADAAHDFRDAPRRRPQGAPPPPPGRLPASLLCDRPLLQRPLLS